MQGVVKESQKITTSSIICALSIVFLITGIIPGIFFISIFVCIGMTYYILDTYGNRYFIAAYIVTSILSLILIPDFELSLTYVCMGWYPIVKKIIDRHNKLLRIVLKLSVYTIASYIIYNISVFVFGVEQIMEGMQNLVIIYISAFAFVFWLLDVSLTSLYTKIIKIYRARKILNKTRGGS